MANKIPTLGEFSIPSAFFDKHEWISDALIDSIVGKNCTLIYPAVFEECPNCILDPSTGRSANIYKSGGPISFQNHTICPWCAGNGRQSTNPTETIKLRVYMDNRHWVPMLTLNPDAIEHPDGYAQIIGYLVDMPKIQQSIKIILFADIELTQRIECKTDGEPLPHGFRKNRYFVQMLKRI